MSRDEARPHGIEGQADTNTMLGKALELVRMLSIRPQGMGTREASRLSGIDKSAVSRILGQLERHGWVERQSESEKYRPGQALYAIGAALRHNDDIWNCARDQLVRLNELYDETVYITRRMGDSIVFRDKVESSQAVRHVVDLGVPFPLTSGGASATAILSVLSAAEQRRILRKGIQRHSIKSVVDPIEFKRMLDADRARGYSLSLGRWAENAGGVSSPYFDAKGVCLGTVTLSCPLFRLEKMDVAELGAAVREAANTISVRFGYSEGVGD